MPRIVEVKNSEFSDNKFWMLQEDGQEGLYEWKREQLVDTVAGEHLVAIRGYSDPFEITTQFGTQAKVKVLFQVIEGKFKDAFFAVMFGDSYGKKAHLNEVFTAAFKEPLAPGSFDWSTVHGQRLYLMVESKPDSKGRGFNNVWYMAARQYDEAAQVPVSIPTNTAIPSYDPFNAAKREARAG